MVSASLLCAVICAAASAASAQGSARAAELSAPAPDVEADDALAMQLRGCTEGLSAEALAERVRLEWGDARRPVTVEVRLECGGPEVTVRVEEADGRTQRTRADLGDAEGTARLWALAIIVADLLRTPPPAAVAHDPPPEGWQTALGPAAALSPPYEPEAPPTGPHSRIGVAAFGRLTFEGATPLAGLAFTYRFDWFRAGLSAATTQRGHPLGEVWAALALVEVAFVPLQHVDSDWAIAAETFLHGGLLYGAGTPLPSRRGRTIGAEAVDLVLGAGLGIRVQVERAGVALSVGLRAGLEPYGTEFLAREDSLIRVYGPFGSLDVGFEFDVE